MATVSVVLFVWFAINLLIVLRLIQVSKGEGERVSVDESETSGLSAGSLMSFAAELQQAV